MEIGAATANQPYTGVETGNHKNQCQKDGAKVSKNLLYKPSEDGGTIGNFKKGRTGNGANMGQHRVGEKKEKAGNQTSFDYGRQNGFCVMNSQCL